MKKISDLLEPAENQLSEKEYALLKAKWYNDSEGNLEGINCEKCKNKGFIEFCKEENGRVNNYVAECECMSRRRALKRAENSGLGEYLKKRFTDYETAEEWLKNIKQKAIKYCKEDSSNWFIMLGQSGAGKTLLCSIIANYLLIEKNQRVSYITWTDYISKLKRDMMSDNTGSVNQYLEEIKNVEILFIDELLKKFNETDLKYIIEIINYRYTNNLKTIITSERTVDELIEIDEATIGRMVEKAGEYVINIPKDKKRNYRLRGVL